MSQCFDAVLFDCDGTLSTIEGINELAKQNGVFAKVEELTEHAMAGVGMHPALYEERLACVRPTVAQLQALADLYWQCLTPDADTVIARLHALGKAVFIVSAGIRASILPFAEKLHIPPERVYSVDVYCDEQGQYRNFDRRSPLVQPDGKSQIATMLRQQYDRIAHIGDGLNDLEAASAVDRFIGYGGVYFRKNIADASEFYIRSPSLVPVLPLLLTTEELARKTS